MSALRQSAISGFRVPSLIQVCIVLLGLAADPSFAGLPSTNPLASRFAGASCDMVDDSNGVPHLRSQNELEVMACLGFIHARDRSWQMDFFRKTAQGRKAEVMGRDAIRSDFFLRLLGLHEKAEALFEKMKPEEKEILWAYSFGVTRGMKMALKNRLPGTYEFERLNYQPEPWHPTDTLSLVFLQSFDQTKRSFQIQLDEMNRKIPAPVLLSPEVVSELPWDATILKKGEYPQTALANSPQHKSNQTRNQPQNQLDSKKLSELMASFGPNLWDVPGSGSNNWVIAPKRSETGNAWLANDPHLKLGYPPFWHWSHLTVTSKEPGKEMDVIGAFFPGVPLVASGTNQNVSWGLTNSFLPVAKIALVPESELAHVPETRPWIWFKFAGFRVPFFFKTFKKTQEGLPILPVPGPAGSALVLHWTGFDLKPDDLMGFYGLMKVKSVKEADHQLGRAGVPSWNFVFADVNGGIGYRTVGRTPRLPKIRAKAQVPHPVSQEVSSEAQGIQDSFTDLELKEAFGNPLSADEMPHLLRPKRNFVVTANNKQWPDDSIWNGGKAQLAGFRGFRIEELIQDRPKHNLESIRKIQCDIQAVDARFLLPHLMKWMEADGSARKITTVDRKGFQLLKAWNYETDVDCTVCGLYRRWIDHLLDATQLTIRELYQIVQHSPEKYVGSAPEEGRTADHHSFSDWIWLSFRDAQQDVQLTEDTVPQVWGKFHASYFDHLGGVDLFSRDRVVNSVPTPGDSFSVNLADADWDGKVLRNAAGPSERLIVEMSKPPKVYMVLAGPNQDLPAPDFSQPASPWQKWVRCEQQQLSYPFNWVERSQKVRKLVL